MRRSPRPRLDLKAAPSPTQHSAPPDLVVGSLWPPDPALGCPEMRFESGEILGWGALATTAATPAGAVPLLGGAVEVRALSLPLHAQEKSHVLLRQVDNGAACAASFLKVPAWARWECAVVLGGGGWVAASSARDLEHDALSLN